MKKNIFLIIGLMITSSLCSETSIHECELDEEQQSVTVTKCENPDEFEDFFGEDNEENNAVPRQQKPKLSPMQLAMMRLGVAVALRVESCCSGIRSLYWYLKSWVVNEKRKA